ncbi:hypothetical protein E2320_016328 [Naja naja]|nr:hypothetical protein E2320_016328 [Naja naja]
MAGSPKSSAFRKCYREAEHQAFASQDPLPRSFRAVSHPLQKLALRTNCFSTESHFSFRSYETSLHASTVPYEGMLGSNLILGDDKLSLKCFLSFCPLLIVEGKSLYCCKVHEWIEVRFTHSEKHVKFVQNIFYENDL